MKTRPGPYEAYWRFAAERQEVFFKRLQGEDPPWSLDPIINEYKFCNAYRASDRVSQYLIRDVIYAHDLPPKDTLFRIVFFRLFSKISTWQFLERDDLVRWKGFDLTKTAQRLEEARRESPIYTSAFILAAHDAFSQGKKHLNHLELLKHMMRSGLDAQVAACGSLEELYHTLKEYPLIGPFMAYQLAIDINYSTLTQFDESSFTVAGPGAKRGIRKCFTDTEGKDDEEVIQWMQANQREEFSRLGIEFKDLGGRELQSIDCQNLFCETDKYSRVAFPHLASNRVKIKQRFHSNPEPIEYFYPPKWGIDLAA